MKYFVCCLVEACLIIISRSWPRTCLCHFRTYDICEYLIKFKNTFDIFFNENWSFWLSYIFLDNLHLIPSLFSIMLITCTETLKLKYDKYYFKDIWYHYVLLFVIILYVIIDSTLTFIVAVVYKCDTFTIWITPKINFR